MAISAFVALVFAAMAAIATSSQLAVLKSEAEQRTHEERSRQARLVYWSEEDGFRWFNVSNEPVHRVSVLVSAPGNDSCEVVFHHLHPTSRQGQRVDFVARYFEHVSKRWAGKKFVPADGRGEGAWGPDAFSAALLFTDAAGRRWKRDINLGLVEIDAATPVEDFLWDWFAQAPAEAPPADPIPLGKMWSKRGDTAIPTIVRSLSLKRPNAKNDTEALDSRGRKGAS